MKTNLLLLLNTVVILIAALLKYPQPTLDWTSVEQMAALHTNNNNDDDGVAPLHDSIIVITGATSGIGRSLTSAVHRMGATIIAVGRSPRKLAALRCELDGICGDTDKRDKLLTVVADLDDLGSIERAAMEISKLVDHVDFLVNNAGIHYSQEVFFPSGNLSTVQGYDLAFGVNYLSHFLLTEKLLPLLEASKNQPRIVQMASTFHALVDGSELYPINDDDNNKSPIASRTDGRTILHRQRSYANSKMAQILHARALARKLEERGSPVTIASVCPGFVFSNMTSPGPLASFVGGRLLYAPDGAGLSSTFNAMFKDGAGDYFLNYGRVNELIMNDDFVALINRGCCGISWLILSRLA